MSVPACATFSSMLVSPCWTLVSTSCCALFTLPVMSVPACATFSSILVSPCWRSVSIWRIVSAVFSSNFPFAASSASCTASFALRQTSLNAARSSSVSSLRAVSKLFKATVKSSAARAKSSCIMTVCLLKKTYLYTSWYSTMHVPPE